MCVCVCVCVGGWYGPNRTPKHVPLSWVPRDTTSAQPFPPLIAKPASSRGHGLECCSGCVAFGGLGISDGLMISDEKLAKYHT